MKICIDPGHGGKYPGAVSNNKAAEKTITLLIGLELGRQLKRHNIDIIYTREDDSTIELYDRCNIANNNNCDYFVSIHLNSFSNPAAKGTETWCYEKGDISEKFALFVNNKIVELLGTVNRGVKYAGKSLYVISNTKMPAILIEVAFLSNPEEEKILVDKAWQIKIAKAIAEGIIEFLGMRWIDEDINTTPPMDNIPIIEEKKVGYDEYLPNRRIIHLNKDVYISLNEDGIYAYSKNGSVKII